jgi:hypothetical protein
MGIEYSGRQTFVHPRWAKDYFNRDSVLPGGVKVDPTQFPREGAVQVTVNGAVTAGATSITVDALTGPIPANTMLRFTGGQMAFVNAAAATGATTLAVDALGFDIPDNAAAWYMGSGKVTIVDGTLIGRTFAERDAKTPFGPAVSTDEEVYALVHTIDDAIRNNDADVYRHGRLIDETHFPGWASLSGAMQTLVRSLYQTTIGVD